MRIAKRKTFLGWAATFLVLVPLVIVAAGYAFAYLIPGCIMLGVNGAHGCHLAGVNLNPLFAFIASWGHIWLVLGIGVFICVLLPIWVIVVAWKEFRKK
ncbi:MAG: hypothetical protein GC183_13815 [Thiobacillus sp.]|nr:hypothetical protein [Thiobacillus sp.]